MPALITKHQDSEENDYILVGDSAWIEVDDILLWIRKGDKGPIVESFVNAESPLTALDSHQF